MLSLMLVFLFDYQWFDDLKQFFLQVIENVENVSQLKIMLDIPNGV